MAQHGVSPDSIISRGPFIARHYHQSTGVHSTRVWCELDVNGARYQPFSQDFECSLGPVEEPAAATLSVEGGQERGLHLLRVREGKPLLSRLGEDPSFNGAWTADGKWYVHGGRAVSVLTGESRPLPAYPGRFLGFSPDERRLVSFTYEPPSEDITLHLIDLASGADEPTLVKRGEHPWLTDATHVIPGTIESAHLWQASHLSWRKTPEGQYTFTLAAP